MCGIVGVASSEGVKGRLGREEFFIQSLFCDTLRGADGTGIALIGGTAEAGIAIAKKAMAAPDFLETKHLPRAFRAVPSPTFMIGHNRKATMGGISTATTHPFQYGDITMVHNGSLYTYGYLPDGYTFKVDSEAICNSINEIGIEETVALLDGAFALVWHDASDNTLNFCRNDKRPFAFGLAEDEDTMLFASEMGMLEWIAARKEVSIDLSGVYTLNPGFLVKVHADNVREYTSKKLKYKQTAVFTSKSYDYYQTDKTTYDNTTKNKVLETKRDSKIATLLQTYQLAVGDTVEFCPLKFVAYPSQIGMLNPLGKLEGWALLEKDACLEVEVHQVRKDEYDTSGTVDFLGRIVSAREGTGMNLDVIVLTDLVELEYTPSDEEDAPKLVLGPNKEWITEEEFDKLTKEGCAYCSDNLEVKDASTITWLEGNTPLCQECWEGYQENPNYIPGSPKLTKVH